jgi:hypothetical protein
MDWLCAELQLEEHSQLYELTAAHCIVNRGKQLMSAFENSMPKLLKSAYPEFTWDEWHFKELQPLYWKDLHNQRAYLDWIAEQLGMERVEDWYHCSAQHVNAVGRHKIVQDLYGNSLVKALTTVYPEFTWHVWKFSEKVPHSYWTHMQHQRLFFDWLAEQLDIRELDDWYQYSAVFIKEHVASNILNQYYKGSLQRALSTIYPEHSWQPWRYLQTPQGAPNHSLVSFMSHCCG